VEQPQTSRDLDRIGQDYQRSAQADQQQRQEREDTCGLAQNQSLIGTPQTELHAPVNARVICFGCMATMDFNPTRLTIQIGADHKVASLRCG
jgi:hypothetical protein